MIYYDDEDGEESPDSVGYIEDDHPLQMHGNRELAAQAVKLLQAPGRPGDASFATSTTDMDVPIYVRGSSISSRSPGNKVNKVILSVFRVRYFFIILTGSFDGPGYKIRRAHWSTTRLPRALAHRFSTYGGHDPNLGTRLIVGGPPKSLKANVVFLF